jgi:tRNA G18 (ribose-2'-O)-methylase SpoU
MRVDLEATDSRLDPYRHVGDPAWLRQHALFVAEGRLVVERLIATRRYALESILVTPTAFAALEPILASADAEVLVCSPARLEQVTGFNFHRGCLALARRAPAGDERWIDRDQVLLVLDGIGNPDNVGSLFRTAAALGAGGLLVTETSADPLYRKAVRTSMGAVLLLPWSTVPTVTAGIVQLRQHGYRVIALTPRPDAVDIETLASRQPRRVALLLGSEGEGLTPETLAAADDRVRIRQAAGVDSLNVTVAAGIALHALRGHLLG